MISLVIFSNESILKSVDLGAEDDEQDHSPYKSNDDDDDDGHVVPKKNRSAKRYFVLY